MSKRRGGGEDPGKTRDSGPDKIAATPDPTVPHSSSSELARACDLLGEGVLIADSAGEIVYANRAAGRLLGLAEGELCGRDLSFLERHLSLPRREGERGASSPQAFGAGAEKSGGAVLRWCRDDREIFLFMSIHPIEGGGRAEGFQAALLRDITTEVRLKEHLIRSERMAAIGELVPGVAHDLNNHLTSVLGYAQLLLARGTDPRMKRGLEVIDAEAGRASGIVQSLLSVSRKQPPRREPHDLNELVGKTLQLKANALRVAQIDIETDLDPNLPQIDLDGQGVQRVILGLLANAEQAVRLGREIGTKRESGTERDIGTERDREAEREEVAEGDRAAEISEAGQGSRGLVRIATRRKGSKIQIILEDDGPGFPRTALPRLFEPFFTAGPQGSGPGLGLPICREIVAEHGGAMRPENLPEGGARVTVELPIVRGEAAAEGLADGTRTSESAVDGPAEGGASPEEGGSVLVVDDEQTVRDVLAAMLELEGRRVDVVSSGEAALELLQSQRYDMVMSDVRMPGVSGIDLYDRLVREDPDLARRMVFITGDLAGGECGEFIRRVDNLRLDKPLTLDKLRETLRLFQERFGSS